MQQTVGALLQAIGSLVDFPSRVNVAFVELVLNHVFGHFHALRDLLECRRFGQVFHRLGHRLRRLGSNLFRRLGGFLKGQTGKRRISHKCHNYLKGGEGEERRKVKKKKRKEEETRSRKKKKKMKEEEVVERRRRRSSGKKKKKK